MTTITVTAPGGGTTIAAVNPLTMLNQGEQEEAVYEYDLETTV